MSDNSVVRMPLSISGKEYEGTYKCTADNGFGKPVSRDVSLTVQSEYVINAVKTALPQCSIHSNMIPSLCKLCEACVGLAGECCGFWQRGRVKKKNPAS